MPVARRRDPLVLGDRDVPVAKAPRRLLAQDAGRLAGRVALDDAAVAPRGRRPARASAARVEPQRVVVLRPQRRGSSRRSPRRARSRDGCSAQSASRQPCPRIHSPRGAVGGDARERLGERRRHPRAGRRSRASDHVGKWTCESVNAGGRSGRARSTRSGVGSALSCVPTPPTIRSPAIASAALVGSEGSIVRTTPFARITGASVVPGASRGAVATRTLRSSPTGGSLELRPSARAPLPRGPRRRSSAAYVLLRRRRPRYVGPLHERRRAARRQRACSRAGASRWRRARSSPSSACSASRSPRPHVNRIVPVENATVVLVVDTSRSMLSDDVAPTRLEAAKAAAQAFLDRAPGQAPRRPRHVRGRRDRRRGADPRPRACSDDSVDAINPFQSGGGGDRDRRRARPLGRARAGRVRASRAPCRPGDRDPRAVTILFLSDGRQNRGLLPPGDGRGDGGARRDPRLHGRARNGPTGRGGQDGSFGLRPSIASRPGRRCARSRRRPAASTSRPAPPVRSRRRTATWARGSAAPSGATEVTSLFVAAAALGLAAAPCFSRGSGRRHFPIRGDDEREVPGAGRGAPAPGHVPHAAGRMFWLTRKTLSGSYAAFTCASRA